VAAKDLTEGLVALGLDRPEADGLAQRVAELMAALPAEQCWQRVSTDLLTPAHPFAVHQFLFEAVYANWPAEQGPPPAWMPPEALVPTTNIADLMRERGLASYADLHAWSVRERERFWEVMIGRLGVRFSTPPTRVMDASRSAVAPEWLPGARLNIADSAFQGPGDRSAIVYRRGDGPINTVTLADLERLANRVAHGLVRDGFRPGDAVAIDAPMTVEAVAAYLGIVKAGCAVVAIADSFAPAEIGKRLRLGGARAVFTQDVIPYGRKRLPLYERVVGADAPRAVVVTCDQSPAAALREGDVTWDAFLSDDDAFDSVPCAPDDTTNILFSSGTTGDPKVIPWPHTAPIKCAADAYLHQNVRPGDVLAWPTNLGWMMGPWLIYASLMNRATMALYYGAPTGREFGAFVQDAGVTMLGLVPSLVRAWRDTGCLDGLDWSAVRAFSSTGECSNPDDMLFLMSRAGYRPVIEYCGGTEIAGGYITGTVVQPSSPATFTTPALGLDFVILDEDRRPADNGEVFLVPPSIGLSSRLLHADHDGVYFADAPTGPGGIPLRRHGDQIERLPGGWFRAHGRTDDTMNLGGIKVSSAEIERVVTDLDEVRETAAVAVAPTGGGAARLVVFAVPAGPDAPDRDALKAAMQAAIRREVNPLFKIDDVVLVDALPRTASGKVMRRRLRADYVPPGSAPASEDGR